MLGQSTRESSSNQGLGFNSWTLIDGIYKAIASQGHLGRACHLPTSPGSCLASRSQQEATKLPAWLQLQQRGSIVVREETGTCKRKRAQSNTFPVHPHVNREVCLKNNLAKNKREEQEKETRWGGGEGRKNRKEDGGRWGGEARKETLPS